LETATAPSGQLNVLVSHPAAIAAVATNATTIALMGSNDTGVSVWLLFVLFVHDDHGRDRFKNPKDLNTYIAAQESPDRAAWQKPDEVLDALDLKPGQTVCDIGAGPGYFALRAAKRIGDSGRVFAVDVEPRILNVLRDRIEKGKLRNITPVLALATDPLLPPRSCDLVLIVDAYHHFPERPRYLARLAALLRPGGRLANVDWHKRSTGFGPPLDHRIAREDFLADAAKANLRVIAEPKLLPHQYFVVLSAQ
jgi:SAM-dependent methyltransferase